MFKVNYYLVKKKIIDEKKSLRKIECNEKMCIISTFAKLNQNNKISEKNVYFTSKFRQLEDKQKMLWPRVSLKIINTN